MHLSSNLILVGPMGAGKTTIGRSLAEHLAMPFLDLDHEIEERTGATIPLIFEMEGEIGFRQRERQTLEHVLQQDGILLATGGGAVLNEANRSLLRKRGFVIWLDTPVSVQLDRLAREYAKRPLLKDTDRRAKLEQLAIDRNPLYAQTAHMVIPSTGRHHGPAQIKQIAETLSQQWQRSPSSS